VQTLDLGRLRRLTVPEARSRLVARQASFNILTFIAGDGCRSRWKFSLNARALHLIDATLSDKTGAIGFN
jgi:hypothetical protein